MAEMLLWADTLVVVGVQFTEKQNRYNLCNSRRSACWRIYSASKLSVGWFQRSFLPPPLLVVVFRGESCRLLGPSVVSWTFYIPLSF